MLWCACLLGIDHRNGRPHHSVHMLSKKIVFEDCTQKNTSEYITIYIYCRYNKSFVAAEMNSSLQEDMFYVFGILVVSFVVVQYVVI